MLRSGDLTAGQIGARLPMSAPSVSHHLNVLKRAGLVRCERRGQTLLYSLEATVLQEVLSQLLDLVSGDGSRAPCESPADSHGGKEDEHVSA
jgi:ArsR family transcriptional regulator